MFTAEKVNQKSRLKDASAHNELSQTPLLCQASPLSLRIILLNIIFKSYTLAFISECRLAVNGKGDSLFDL